MRFRVVVAAIVFIGSYLPLSLILLAQNYDYSMLNRPICWNWMSSSARCVMPLSNPGFAIGIFVVCLVCFCLTLGTLAIVKAKREIVLHEVSHQPAELMNYVLPYVVSFMSIDYQDTGKFIGVLIFLAWMFWLTFKSGQIILNPLLIAFGWRLYNLSYSFPGGTDIHNGRALANTSLVPKMRYPHAAIQDVLIVKVARNSET